MKKINLLFAEYGESHRNPTNKGIHWICVPLIFWSILGFISIIPAPHLYIEYYGMISVISLLAIVIVSIYYLKLSWRIGLIMIFIMLFLEYTIYQCNIFWGSRSWMVYLATFAITWLFQFIGHHIEGKKPSFLKDIQFLLIGPIWLLHFVMKKLGLKY